MKEKNGLDKSASNSIALLEEEERIKKRGNKLIFKSKDRINCESFVFKDVNNKLKIFWCNKINKTCNCCNCPKLHKNN